MSVSPIEPPATMTDPPPLARAARQTIDDLGEVAREAADRMRTGTDPAYRLGQAERSIATYEAIGYVRDLLDIAEQEQPART